MKKHTLAIESWAPWATDFTETPLGLVAIQPFMFTYGLLVDVKPYFYKCRYCYPDLVSCRGALKDWQEKGFEGEPEGYITKK